MRSQPSASSRFIWYSGDVMSQRGDAPVAAGDLERVEVQVEARGGHHDRRLAPR